MEDNPNTLIATRELFLLLVTCHEVATLFTSVLRLTVGTNMFFQDKVPASPFFTNMLFRLRMIDPVEQIINNWLIHSRRNNDSATVVYHITIPQ